MIKRFAIILAVVMLSSCVTVKENITSIEENSNETVVLNMMTMGVPPASGLDSFHKSLDELTIPELGMQLRVNYIEWGTESTRIPMAIASGTVDLICGGTWSNFTEYAQKNAFIDMLPYLENMPELTNFYAEQMGADFLQRTYINGGLYGLVQLKLQEPGDGIFYREDLRHLWEVPEMYTLEAVEQYLYKAKENKYKYSISDDRLLFFIWNMIGNKNYLNISSVISINLMDCFVISPDSPDKVISIFDTEDFLQCLEIAARWYSDGIISKDVVAGRQGEMLDLMVKDIVCVEMCNHLTAIENYYLPVLQEEHPEWAFNFIPYTKVNGQTPIYLQSALGSGCVSISVFCEYPQIAMEFLEKAYTDEQYSRLVQYGVNGINYELIDGAIAYPSTDERFRPFTGMVNYVFEYETYNVTEDWQELSKSLRTEVQQQAVLMNKYSPLETFVFDPSLVYSQISEINNVLIEYAVPLTCGVVTNSVEEDLDVLLYHLDNVGYYDVMEELQQQLFTFLN